MIEMQLYIQDQRVDVFADESVTLKDSIQNVRDIEKVFTSFSQSFNLPASKTNNKIFKHYYNFNIEQDFAFDARVKTKAYIELNSLPFRAGYIKLEGVNLKNNIPSSYRITFFGEIVKLKDAIGESKLSDLLNLGTTPYSSSNMQTLLSRNPEGIAGGFSVIAPLITHSQRLYFNSNQSDTATGNLAPGANVHGVYWNQLKPAMRLNRIIEAIEDTFPEIEFTDDFFKNENVPEMDKLFMWLSRKSGAVENLSGNFETETKIFFPSATSQQGHVVSNYGAIYISANIPWNGAGRRVFSWTYTLSTQNTDPYIVEIYDFFGQLVYQSAQTVGNLTIQKADMSVPTGPVQLTLFIRATAPVTFLNIKADVVVVYAYYLGMDLYDNLTVQTNGFTTGSEFIFDYAKQMPDITIIDFLSGLFKMFNLTAFVQDDGKIKVERLNDFYNDNPTYRDITEYVGIDEMTIDAALPYRQVKFLFKGTESILANKYGEINNKAWGLLSYNNGQNDLSGSLYKIEAPFGHFLFERINDQFNGNQEDLQWGYSVDKSENAINPKPLLFYPLYAGNDTPQISFVTDFDQNGNPVSDTTMVPRSLPMNHYALDPANGNFQLNFAQEVSEWTLQNNFTETLFTAYQKYILSIFNPKQRITKVTVMLPLAVMLSIKMNDRIIISGNHYKINSLTTNLKTGKSELELLNDYFIE